MCVCVFSGRAIKVSNQLHANEHATSKQQHFLAFFSRCMFSTPGFVNCCCCCCYYTYSFNSTVISIIIIITTITYYLLLLDHLHSTVLFGIRLFCFSCLLSPSLLLVSFSFCLITWIICCCCCCCCFGHDFIILKQTNKQTNKSNLNWSSPSKSSSQNNNNNTSKKSTNFNNNQGILCYFKSNIIQHRFKLKSTMMNEKIHFFDWCRCCCCW